MNPKVLKDEVFAEIENENVLLANLASVLNISLASIPNMLTRKSRRFTEFPALKLIADFLHCEMDELLIDDAKVESKV